MSIYTSTARFDNARALTEDELYRAAPSIFATEAHSSRSERFAPIPTIEIVRGLAKQGFSVVGAQQGKSRDTSRREFTKHLLRIRKLDDDVRHSVGGSVVEMLLKNGNDGSSAYDLMSGVFRIACMNSMVAKLADIDTLKVRHSGNALDKVIEGTFTVMDNAETVMGNIERWQSKQLSDRSQMAFAVGAHAERFADAEGVITTPVKPEQLLQPRRLADTGSDLWSVFNRVQENVIRGGLHARGERRNVTTREVKGIDQSVKLNSGLWQMAAWLEQNAA